MSNRIKFLNDVRHRRLIWNRSRVGDILCKLKTSYDRLSNVSSVLTFCLIFVQFVNLLIPSFPLPSSFSFEPQNSVPFVYVTIIILFILSISSLSKNLNVLIKSKPVQFHFTTTLQVHRCKSSDLFILTLNYLSSNIGV